MLTISAKDFGPIIEGTVDLKPLTVFVGPSNTGKSYMATLIYALMQARAGGSYPPYFFYHDTQGARRIPYIAMEPTLFPNELGSDLENVFVSWAKQIEIGEEEQYSFRIDSLPNEIQALMRNTIASYVVAFVDSFAGELQRFHGEVADFRRRYLPVSDVKLALDQGQPPLSIAVSESSGHSKVKLIEQSVDMSDLDLHLQGFFIRTLRVNLPINDPRGSSLRGFDVLHHLVWNTINNMVQDLLVGSYYLPAARSGIAQGHRIIASTLIRQSPFAGIQRMEIPQFSGVIANFMSHLLTIGQVRVDELSPELQESIEFLEQKVVRGEINLQETGQLTYPEIYYEPFRGQPNAGKFALNQTSSMVSELAPIILFLKYLVRPGDLLILEEPESHLHPDAQRQMARGIVRLVNAGVKVLITTHSDYLVSQINNLLRISFASDRWLKREGFAREDCLKHDDVSAYAFEWDESEGGSRVRELEIRKDVGIDEDEFGKVVNAQYEETILVERIRPKW